MRKTILILIFCILLSTPVVYANNSIKDYFDNPYNNNNITNIKSLSGNIYTLIQTIGLGTSVCLIAYMGIQWMISSPSKRAELKGRLIYYIAGIVLLVGGSSIIGIYKNFVDQSVSGQTVANQPVVPDENYTSGSGHADTSIRNYQTPIPNENYTSGSGHADASTR